MQLYVDTAVKIISDSPSDISQNCSVSRGMWYLWTHKYDWFEEWFYSQYKLKRYRWLPQLDRIGMQRAPKNFDYWKAMNQKAGELLDQGNVSITGDKVVAIMGGVTTNYNKEPIDDKATNGM